MGKSTKIGLVLIVDQDAQRRAVEIFELARTRRPEKGGQTGQAQYQGDRDQDDETCHRAAPRNLSALATTSKDEPDMASAAMSGVTCPAIASGTASRL